MKNAAKYLALIALALWSVQAAALPLTVYHADGTRTLREVHANAPAQDERSIAATVTLNTSLQMNETVGFTEILAAAPGQTVNLSTLFNALGSLEVPFQALIGRQVLVSFYAPGIGLSTNFTVTIEAGDENVIGYGINYTIPLNAPTGPFRTYGLDRIGGVQNVNNSANFARLVRAPAAP